MTTATPVSTLRAFEAGDVFVGATLLNDPDDDHAGAGRIIQFDADLNEKGVLWVEGTTHLVYGLTFAPDGVLWAFDPWEWLIVRVSPDGHQLASLRFADRAFSMVHFASDGSLYFTESLGGAHQPEPLTTRHKPMPGHRRRLGDGCVYHYRADGELIRTLDTDYHGGMSGSMAVTHSVMTADGQRLIYVSETGPRLMQYDLVAERQLPDLQSLDASRHEMLFDLALLPDETLLVCRGDRVARVAPDGRETRSYPLEGFGWSVIGLAAAAGHAFVGNWFSGEIVRLDLGDGTVTARASVGEKCMAGIAQYCGRV